MSVPSIGQATRKEWAKQWLPPPSVPLPPLPPPPLFAPLSIAAAQHALAPSRPASAWLASPGVLPAARRSSLSSSGGVVLASGLLVVDDSPRFAVSDSSFSPDGRDLPLTPAVFTALCDRWPVRDWSASAIAQRAAPLDAFSVDGGPFFARSSMSRASVSASAYAEYCEEGGGASLASAPLYIFDDEVSSRTCVDGSSFFGDDVVRLLPPWLSAAVEFGSAAPSVGSRPLPLEWLLVGAAGSGTPVHCHPNTVAALVLLKGCKLWVCLPPDTPEDDVLLLPPLPEDDGKAEEDKETGDTTGGGEGGVGEDDDDDDEDDEDVAAGAWMESWFARGGLLAAAPGASVFVQSAGETVFVPAGFWHCVLNVQDSTALSVSRYLERDTANL